MVGWRAIYLLAGCLMALSQTTNAQGVRAVRTIQGGAGGGVGFQSVQALGGSGPERGFNVVIGGPGGPIDIGASLLKTCDTNQDGAATPSGVKASLLNWFQQADTDTNGALSEVELATALKQIFPVPEPPPGLPSPPEEFGLHNLLAKNLMASVDANKDGWIILKEAVAFVDESFPKWDLDSSGSLDASEFANAFAQLMPPPPDSQGIGISGSTGGKFFRTFRAP